jgi:hypothetical protein
VESRVEVGPRFRSLLEAVAERLSLTRGRCAIVVHLEDGRVSSVSVETRVPGGKLEQLLPDVLVDEILAGLRV